MNGRDLVLQRIRAALAATPSPPAVAADEVPRTYRHEGSVPTGSGDALALLSHRLLDYRATVLRCTPYDAPQVIASQLVDVGSVVVPGGVPTSWVAVLTAAGVAVRVDEQAAPLTHAELDGTSAVLTSCRVAIAETGTVVLDGAPDQGRRALSLLPDRHVCVVRADQVVGSVPQAVALLAEHPARPLTWISGPSATSDIELVRVEGVHGPRDLRVILVESQQ